MFIPNKERFKNSNGLRLTRALFFELATDSKEFLTYTLKQEDHLGYPSLYLLYLDSCLLDPTEYSFAKKYFLDWDHWDCCTKLPLLIDYIKVWRQEVSKALESRYVSKMQELADKGGKEAFVANRYLLERLQKPAGGLKRGRPYKGSSQEEIASTAFLEASEAKVIESDLLRLKSGNNPDRPN